uniref:hypothetical protein n=1 Tax=Pseudonocardia sp. CA-138482 TaxID=3240023 RepID=UPI003F4908E3
MTKSTGTQIQISGILRETSRTGPLSDDRPGRRYVVVKVLDPKGRFLPVNPETGGPDEAGRYELVKRYI